MGVQENKEIARRYFENGWNEADLKQFDEILSDDFVLHTSGPDIRGREGIKQRVIENRAGLPDLKFDIEEMIGVGRKVVVRWRGTGTQTGTWRGIPPTGKYTSNRGIDIMRFGDGQIVEIWNNADTLGVYQQLGVVGEDNGEGQPVADSTIDPGE
jgi:steroid delta-isomerase-like uncharacterized protein